MKHYQGCSGHAPYCRCDEVDLTIRLSPEAQLDAMWEIERHRYLTEDGGDPAADWLAVPADDGDGCFGCGQRPRWCCCPDVNFGDARPKEDE